MDFCFLVFWLHTVESRMLFLELSQQYEVRSKVSLAKLQMKWVMLLCWVDGCCDGLTVSKIVRGQRSLCGRTVNVRHATQ